MLVAVLVELVIMQDWCGSIVCGAEVGMMSSNIELLVTVMVWILRVIDPRVQEDMLASATCRQGRWLCHERWG